MPYFIAIFAMMSASGTSETFYMGCISTLIASLFFIGVSLFKFSVGLWQSFAVSVFLLILGVGLPGFLCFLWNLVGGNSVHWCLSKFTCVAFGSLDTCLICLLLTWRILVSLPIVSLCWLGIYPDQYFESFIVLDTNSSSLRKNQNMSICKILAISWGYLA